MGFFEIIGMGLLIVVAVVCVFWFWPLLLFGYFGLPNVHSLPGYVGLGVCAVIVEAAWAFLVEYLTNKWSA